MFWKRKKKYDDSHKFHKGYERFVPMNIIMGVVMVILLWLFGLLIENGII